MSPRTVPLLPAFFAMLVAASALVPAGAQEDFARERAEMVRLLTKPVFGRTPVRDERVLAAMAKVPRHEFVSELREHAYEDRPLPIGEGQTISQPYIVAAMTEAIRPKPGDVVLEIGTGSGYQAAVLAELVKEVYTIEIVPELGARAAGALARLGYSNVFPKIGDGYKGWNEHAPYDGIVVTAAPDHIPQPLIDQLKAGGRMVIPVGPEQGIQKLLLIEKAADGSVTQRTLDRVRFVPLTGDEQRSR